MIVLAFVFSLSWKTPQHGHPHSSLHSQSPLWASSKATLAFLTRKPTVGDSNCQKYSENTHLKCLIQLVYPHVMVKSIYFLNLDGQKSKELEVAWWNRSIVPWKTTQNTISCPEIFTTWISKSTRFPAFLRILPMLPVKSQVLEVLWMEEIR